MYTTICASDHLANCCCVTVFPEPNGPGIPEDIQSKIFEPYFTTRDFGSGLGLTLVYKIIKEHFGEIILDSKLGVGSVFAIRLPIPQSEQHLLDFQGK